MPPTFSLANFKRTQPLNCFTTRWPLFSADRANDDIMKLAGNELMMQLHQRMTDRVWTGQFHKITIDPEPVDLVRHEERTSDMYWIVIVWQTKAGTISHQKNEMKKFLQRLNWYPPGVDDFVPLLTPEAISTAVDNVASLNLYFIAKLDLKIQDFEPDPIHQTSCDRILEYCPELKKYDNYARLALETLKIDEIEHLKQNLSEEKNVTRSHNTIKTIRNGTLHACTGDKEHMWKVKEFTNGYKYTGLPTIVLEALNILGAQNLSHLTTRELVQDFLVDAMHRLGYEKAKTSCFQRSWIGIIHYLHNSQQKKNVAIFESKHATALTEIFSDHDEDLQCQNCSTILHGRFTCECMRCNVCRMHLCMNCYKNENVNNIIEKVLKEAEGLAAAEQSDVEICDADPEDEKRASPASPTNHQADSDAISDIQLESSPLNHSDVTLFRGFDQDFTRGKREYTIISSEFTGPYGDKDVWKLDPLIVDLNQESSVKRLIEAWIHAVKDITKAISSASKEETSELCADVLHMLIHMNFVKLTPMYLKYQGTLIDALFKVLEGLQFAPLASDRVQNSLREHLKKKSRNPACCKFCGASLSWGRFKTAWIKKTRRSEKSSVFVSNLPCSCEIKPCIKCKIPAPFSKVERSGVEVDTCMNKTCQWSQWPTTFDWHDMTEIDSHSYSCMLPHT